MSTTAERLSVVHVIKGERHANATEDFGTFMCPKVGLDELVWPRSEPGPAFDTPISEIIDFLAEVGRALDLDSNELLRKALEESISCNALEGRIIENTYRAIPRVLRPIGPRVPGRAGDRLGTDRWMGPGGPSPRDQGSRPSLPAPTGPRHSGQHPCSGRRHHRPRCADQGSASSQGAGQRSSHRRRNFGDHGPSGPEPSDGQIIFCRLLARRRRIHRKRYPASSILRQAGRLGRRRRRAQRGRGTRHRDSRWSLSIRRSRSRS